MLASIVGRPSSVLDVAGQCVPVRRRRPTLVRLSSTRCLNSEWEEDSISLDVLGERARAGRYHSCLDNRVSFGCVRYVREPFGRSGFVLLAPSGPGLWFELFEQGVGVY